MKKLTLFLSILIFSQFSVYAGEDCASCQNTLTAETTTGLDDIANAVGKVPNQEPEHPTWEEIRISFKTKAEGKGSRLIKRDICRTITQKAGYFKKITSNVGVTIAEAVIGESCLFKRVNNSKFNREYKGIKVPPLHTMVLSAGKSLIRLTEIINYFIDNNMTHLLERAFNQKDARGRTVLDLIAFTNKVTNGKKKEGLGFLQQKICSFKRAYNKLERNKVYTCPTL